MPWNVEGPGGLPEYPKSVSENLNIAVDCTLGLDTDELLTGTPTATVSGMTISNISVLSAAKIIDGLTVAIGKGFTFQATGGTAASIYEIKWFCTTTATPAQSRQIRNLKISVQAD